MSVKSSYDEEPVVTEETITTAPHWRHQSTKCEMLSAVALIDSRQSIHSYSGHTTSSGMSSRGILLAEEECMNDMEKPSSEDNSEEETPTPVVPCVLNNAFATDTPSSDPPGMYKEDYYESNIDDIDNIIDGHLINLVQNEDLDNDAT
jgi:hypothetical protein